MKTITMIKDYDDSTDRFSFIVISNSSITKIDKIIADVKQNEDWDFEDLKDALNGLGEVYEIDHIREV